MYVCIYMCMCIYVYIHLCIYEFMYMPLYVIDYAFAPIYCIYIYEYIYKYIYMYIYIYVCTYLCKEYAFAHIYCLYIKCEIGPRRSRGRGLFSRKRVVIMHRLGLSLQSCVVRHTDTGCNLVPQFHPV